MAFFETSYVSIDLDQVNRLTSVIFKGYMNSEQLREAYDMILECCVKNRTTRILGDCRQFVTVTASDQKWMVENWTPRMVKAGVRKSALVVPGNMIQKQVIEKMNKEHSSQDDTLQVQNFGSINEALAWLKR